MSNKILDEILADTFVQSQALHRISALKSLVLVQLFAGKGQEKAVAPEIDPQLAPGQQTPWIVSLNPKIYQHFNKDNVYQMFEELEQTIKKIEPLTLYLPFELPENELAKIGAQLRHDFGQNFLMEVKIDPSLLAGCALIWKGVYKDYSLKRKIEENRQKILETLKGGYQWKK